ncbi:MULTISPECIES: BMC domain-containing protein [Clostridiaceae]|uniref:BMC domain-containing protein n=1 Tax=Clostridium facile TaxID=2763035 RepID=A0ABR7IPP8_9CLOT|nr:MULTISPECIES: BMC domain-containing protein [Clostridiaceae]MBC5787119.1 BMC domain-containing protein [Clostridium facile]
MADFGMKIRVIKNISQGTKDIVAARCRLKDIKEKLDFSNALALCHGDVCDLIYASDLAQKAAGVTVFEIAGNCPQHLTCLGILGDVAAVEEAVRRIREGL